ncbi:hypothetical protein QYF36_007805 [Acer negundo]|nr:hypothetical protein QYF36_007805 [Acer negundo]
MNDCLFLLDYRRTTAGRRCHCDLVPSVLFTERSETSKERESTLMSVIIRKEETESHLLGWSSWHEELGFDKRIKTIAVSGSTTPLGRSVSSASFHSDLNLLVVFKAFVSERNVSALIRPVCSHLKIPTPQRGQYHLLRSDQLRLGEQE